MDKQFITKPATGLFSRVINSPHTSLAAAIWAGFSIFSKVGVIWFPEHAEQFKQTADVIKDIAVTYGFIMGGDSGQKPAPPSTTPSP